MLHALESRGTRIGSANRALGSSSCVITADEDLVEGVMAITGAGAPAAIDAVAVTADVLIGHITYCWGAVWTCPGLERRIRSLLDLTMLTALNCSHELTIHVPGALRNGCTEDEIRETLLQAMIYCGVPAGMEAFRDAVEVLDGEEQGAAAWSGDGPAHTPTVRPGAEPRGDGCS